MTGGFRAARFFVPRPLAAGYFWSMRGRVRIGA